MEKSNFGEWKTIVKMNNTLDSTRNHKGWQIQRTDVFIAFSKDAEQDWLSFANCHCDGGLSFKVEGEHNKKGLRHNSNLTISSFLTHMIHVPN